MLSTLLATAAIAACPQTDAGPPVSVQLESEARGNRYVACDHRAGRRVLVRRVNYAGGRELHGADAAGRRVAYAEMRTRGAVTRGWIVTVRVGRTGRVRIVDRRRVRRFPSELVGVGLTTRGELFWLSRGRILLSAPGRRVRVVLTGASSVLGVDDDRTLAWQRRGSSDVRFRELRPGPGGCAPRERFSLMPGVSSLRYRVSIGHYGNQVIRVCDVTTGRETVVFQQPGSRYEWIPLDPRIVGDHLLISRYAGDGGCLIDIVPVRIRDARRGRAVQPPHCGGWHRTLTAGWAVTDAGVPAWIDVQGELHRLMTVAPGGDFTEVDRGSGPEAIANLRADGAAVRWTNAGVERSAVLP